MECKLENIDIYYEIYGEGYPVLMIHGWPVLYFFTRLIRAL